MTDIPGDSSTTASVTVGSTTDGTLEAAGDHDWYRITLTAGQSITITINGVTLEDPYLYVRDASGNLLFSNDDISSGINRNSQLSFTATYSGTYFIDVGAYDEFYSGTYQIVVTTYTPPPLATDDQIANQLTSGYWGGDSHHFNVTQGGTITVNISTLNAAEQALARAALAVWSDIIGVQFQEVTTGGQIVFDHTEDPGGPIAATDANWSNGITTSAHIQISTSWVTNYGTGLDTYSFQTYVHEIGHALGLGHAGNYNGDARYPYDALFENDAWSTSIMSYFSQHDNTYFGGQGFSEVYAVTPMLADIVAMQALYGLSTTTRTGDTTYGFNSNAGTIYNANLYPDVAYTVFDSGGVDTLDFSGSSANQTINLNPETFSSVNGLTGNIAIARGVVIENAIGGSGNDNITGNSANNVLNGGAGNDTISGGGGDDVLIGGTGIDSLTGGVGFDVFQGTKASLSGDTIADFGAGDKIVITDATLAGFTFSLTGNILTFTGGSLTFGSAVTGTIVASAAAGGGVQLMLQPTHDPDNDFNGDGKSDVLWRSDTGLFSDWLAAASGTGGFANNDSNAFTNVPTNWHVVGTGDFNGDGKDDVLWRSDSGLLSDWLASASGTGGFTNNDANALTNVPTNWTVVGVGDFNGDGKDDILWRSTTGQLSDWLASASGSGGFANNDANALTSVPTNWTVVGVGDFNGDGKDDILWRSDTGLLSDWLGQSNGGFVTNDANAFTNVPTNWKVVGVGDFNGDGKDDILWRSDTGQLSDWLGQANGGFVTNDANAFATVPTNWHVADIGDYNGDGRDDILWRNDAGQFSDWLAQANGGFAPNDANAFTNVPTNWHVQSPDSFWL